jgi:hypothetical protein
MLGIMQWAQEQDLLLLWTIYEKPLDYPGGYVLRAYTVGREGDPFRQEKFYATSAQELRDSMPPTLNCLGRHYDDDPAILETWT